MTDEVKEVSIQEKIILATITCIERDGLPATTNRSIAKEAAVNSAAINYYFSSKDILVQKVLDMTINEAFSNNWQEVLDAHKNDPYQALKEFFIITLNGAVKFPNLTKAHFMDPFLNNDYSNPALKVFSGFLNELLEKFTKLFPEEKGIQFSIVQMWSSIMSLSLIPGLFSEFTELELGNTETHRRYIDHLFKKFFNK